MSRLFRSLVVLAITGAILAGPAFAGPGGPSYSGDPEIPNSTYLWNDVAPTIEVDRGDETVSESTRVPVHRSWMGQMMRISLKLAWLFPR
jgi:hypothetical protein